MHGYNFSIYITLFYYQTCFLPQSGTTANSWCSTLHPRRPTRANLIDLPNYRISNVFPIVNFSANSEKDYKNLISENYPSPQSRLLIAVSTEPACSKIQIMASDKFHPNLTKISRQHRHPSSKSASRPKGEVKFPLMQNFLSKFTKDRAQNWGRIPIVHMNIIVRAFITIRTNYNTKIAHPRPKYCLWNC